jgi:hypothetical protein
MNLRTVVVTLFILAIATNLLQLNFVPSKGRYSPIPRQPTRDITILANGVSGPRAKFGLFFELGRRYPGSTIILPQSPQPPASFQAYALSYGRAKQAAVEAYDSEAVLNQLDYKPFIVATGKGDARNEPFVIAAGPKPKVFLAPKHESTRILLDRSLLSTARSAPRD